MYEYVAILDACFRVHHITFSSFAEQKSFEHFSLHWNLFKTYRVICVAKRMQTISYFVVDQKLSGGAR